MKVVRGREEGIRDCVMDEKERKVGGSREEEEEEKGRRKGRREMEKRRERKEKEKEKTAHTQSKSTPSNPKKGNEQGVRDTDKVSKDTHAKQETNRGGGKREKKLRRKKRTRKESGRERERELEVVRKKMSEWTVDDVIAYLGSIGMKQLQEVFFSHTHTQSHTHTYLSFIHTFFPSLSLSLSPFLSLPSLFLSPSQVFSANQIDGKDLDLLDGSDLTLLPITESDAVTLYGHIHAQRLEEELELRKLEVVTRVEEWKTEMEM